MEHLLSSRVKILRLKVNAVSGRGGYGHQTVKDPDHPTEDLVVPVRFDLQFVRPGKDAPPPIEAGKAPDRFGLMLALLPTPFLAGDWLLCVEDEFGNQPIKGTFELKAIPDEAQDYNSAHHIEVQVQEVAQPMAGFPGSS